MPIQTLKRAIGIFENRDRAVDAILALMEAGFPANQILGIARDWRGYPLKGPRVDLQRASAQGAIVGTVAGGILGAIVGVGVALIPGVPLSLIWLGLLGAALGAAIGCYLGPFVALQVTETEAKKHAREIDQGRAVVVVRTEDRQDEAWTLMGEHGAYDFSMTTEP